MANRPRTVVVLLACVLLLCAGGVRAAEEEGGASLDESSTEVHMSVHESASDQYNTNAHAAAAAAVAGAADTTSGARRGVAMLLRALDSVVKRLQARVATMRVPSVGVDALRSACALRDVEFKALEAQRVASEQRSGGVSQAATSRRLRKAKSDLRRVHKVFLRRNAQDTRAAGSLIRLCNAMIDSMRSKATPSRANWLEVETGASSSASSSAAVSMTTEIAAAPAARMRAAAFEDGIRAVTSLVSQLKSQLDVFAQQRHDAALLIQRRVSFVRGCGDLAVDIHPSNNSTEEAYELRARLATVKRACSACRATLAALDGERTRLADAKSALQRLIAQLLALRGQCAAPAARASTPFLRAVSSAVGSAPLGQWAVGAWSSCVAIDAVKRCGDGVQTRTVTCEGAPCVSIQPAAQRACFTAVCPQDCVVSAWSEFTACTAECAPGGFELRHRFVQVPGHSGGRACPVLYERRACNQHVACPQTKVAPPQFD